MTISELSTETELFFKQEMPGEAWRISVWLMDPILPAWNRMPFQTWLSSWASLVVMVTGWDVLPCMRRVPRTSSAANSWANNSVPASKVTNMPGSMRVEVVKRTGLSAPVYVVSLEITGGRNVPAAWIGV